MVDSPDSDRDILSGVSQGDSPDSDRGILSGVSQWLTLQILTETCSLESHRGHTIPVNPYSLPVYKKIVIISGGYGHIGKWIQENIIFMGFCCCFKLREKIEKLLNEQLTNAH